MALAITMGCSAVSASDLTVQQYSIKAPTQASLPSITQNHSNLVQRKEMVQQSLSQLHVSARQLGVNIKSQLSFLAPIAFASMSEQQAQALRQAGYDVFPSAKMHLVEALTSEAVNQQVDNTPWGVAKVNAEDAWVKTTGRNAKVCVVDGGMDIDHYDLASNFVIGNSLDRQNDTVDDDENSHGTHVAGTIAAMKNDTGVVGVAPDAQLYIADVFDSNGSAYTSDILEGVEWCVEQGAQVINMSYGGSSSDSNQESVYRAAYNAGVVMVAASGNAGANSLPIYPARYDTTIAVNGTDSNDNIYNNGQQGPQIDVSAPGVSITSTTINGNTGQKTGTSMAAPHVTGAVALILDINPSLGVEDVRRILRNTSVDLGQNGHDNAFGAGRIDVLAAVNAADDGDISTDLEASFTYAISDVFNVNFNDESEEGTDDNGDEIRLESWTWDFGDRNTSTEQNPRHAYSAEGNYQVTLVVTDTAGNSDEFSETITIRDGNNGNEKELTPGANEPVGGAKGEWSYFYFDNQGDISSFNVKTAGGSGDIDLYVRYLDNPDLSQFDCRSYTPSNSESCTINAPKSGIYKVGVYSYADSQGATLNLTVQGDDDNGGSCDGIPAWSASKQYRTGDKVSYNAVEYRALWWNYNRNPEQNHGTWFATWEKVGSCRN